MRSKRRTAQLCLLVLIVLGGGAAEAPGAAAGSRPSTRILAASGIDLFSFRPGVSGYRELRRLPPSPLAVTGADLGGRIAILRNFRTETASGGSRQIYTVEPGRAPQPLLSERWPPGKATSVAISRRGEMVAFGGGDGLWIARHDGAGLRQIHAGGHVASAAFSPDGSRVLFSKRLISNRRTEGEQILVVPATGGEASVLVDRPGFSRVGAVSAQGLVAFSYVNPLATEGEIIVMRLDGSGARTVARGGGDSFPLAPDFSPNGRSLVYALGIPTAYTALPSPARIASVRTGGTGRRVLRREFPLGRPRGLSWVSAR